MDKKANAILADFKTIPNTQQGDSMSQPEINEEAKGTIPDSAKDEAAKVVEGTKGIFKVTMEKIKTTVVGGASFAKESILTAWNAALNYYKGVKKNIEEKGVLKWFTDGFRKNAYGFLKLSLKVTAFVLVHNLIVNATGFSVLNPYFLLSILVIAIGLSVYSSIKAQKEITGTATAKATGSQLMEEMIAA